MADSKQTGNEYLEEFMCSVCLELFNVPVMLECGHNFCRACITKVWDVMKTPSCPECREESPAKRYAVNRLLANQVERAKRLKLQQKRKVDGGNVGVKEIVIEQYCRQHGRKLELFCQQDMLLSCVLCVPEHRTHCFLPLYEAAVMYKDKIGTAMSSLQSEMNHLIENQHKQEKKISDIRDTSQNLKQHIKSEFVKLHLFLEDKEQQLIQHLKDDTERIRGKMEENLREMKTRSSTLQEDLSAVQFALQQEDFLCFLTEIQPVMGRLTKVQEEDITYNAEVVSDDLNKGMYSYFLQYDVWKEMKCILSLAPAPLLLNPDTAHPTLILSEDLSSVRYGGDVMKQLPNNPERFDKKPYVLGSTGFSQGRHYWEVDVGTKNTWILGVAKESINRKGETLKRPETGYWMVWRSDEKFFALDSVDKTLCLTDIPQKIRVYLDYDRGELSFYNGDNMSHIYTFTDTFTEKLFPIFSPWYRIDDNNSEALKLFHLCL
ncbi:zinc-binding protein A33-like [Protopterus annectens]|uniref:zinc-binding protein A33-like n=1 Tax=Protopterus annectens TaxID=7888 RepID=UPI001CFAD8DE|nr:zinc-binding protein A33-like [Protopterus annectens]